MLRPPPRSSREALRLSARRPPPRSSGAARRWSPPLNAWRSTNAAGIFLQQRPGLVAELGFRILIERCLREGRLASFGLGRVKDETLCLQRLLVIRICRNGAVSLLDRGGVEMLLHDLLGILRHALPGPCAGEKPETIPRMVGERTELLHFIEFRGLDQGQRILLPVRDLGLQRGIGFV